MDHYVLLIAQNTMKTKQQKLLAKARSLFERLKIEYSTQEATRQLKIILQNAELREKLQRELKFAA